MFYCTRYACLRSLLQLMWRLVQFEFGLSSITVQSTQQQVVHAIDE